MSHKETQTAGNWFLLLLLLFAVFPLESGSLDTVLRFIQVYHWLVSGSKYHHHPVPLIYNLHHESDKWRDGPHP